MSSAEALLNSLNSAITGKMEGANSENYVYNNACWWWLRIIKCSDKGSPVPDWIRFSPQEHVSKLHTAIRGSPMQNTSACPITGVMSCNLLTANLPRHCPQIMARGFTARHSRFFCIEFSKKFCRSILLMTIYLFLVDSMELRIYVLVAPSHRR